MNKKREEAMYVENIMNKEVVTVTMDDSLKVVKTIFDQSPFHHLLVVEAGKLFGVISDRDLLKAMSPNVDTISETVHDLASLNKRVHQIMTRKPVTLSPRAEIGEAIQIFNRHSISCIPIVDAENRPVGIITWRNILKEIAAREG
jgi:acetoin utilization protein AcuB